MKTKLPLWLAGVLVLLWAFACGDALAESGELLPVRTPWSDSLVGTVECHEDPSRDSSAARKRRSHYDPERPQRMGSGVPGAAQRRQHGRSSFVMRTAAA